MKKVLCILAVCLVLSACADAVPVSTASNASGFLVGLWHGLILPIAFVISLFNHHVGIYETVNTGWPYNLGYLLGVAGVLGGASNSVR